MKFSAFHQLLLICLLGIVRCQTEDTPTEGGVPAPAPTTDYYSTTTSFPTEAKFSTLGQEENDPSAAAAPSGPAANTTTPTVPSDANSAEIPPGTEPLAANNTPAVGTPAPAPVPVPTPATAASTNETSAVAPGTPSETSAPEKPQPESPSDQEGTISEQTESPEGGGEGDDKYGEEGGDYGEGEYGGEGGEDDNYGDEWGELPEEEGTPAPYVPPTGDDPFKDTPDVEGWNSGEEWPQETPQQMMHDKNVIIAVSCTVAVGFVLAIFTAQQVIENPDGCCASICRCSVSIFCFFFKILCFPCRMCCGNKDRRTHDLMVGGSDSYTHDLELT